MTVLSVLEFAQRHSRPGQIDSSALAVVLTAAAFVGLSLLDADFNSQMAGVLLR